MAGMHLTPEILAGAYEYLRTTPPFRRWKLPHADEVRFRVSATISPRAFYLYDRAKDPPHEIVLSAKRHGTTHSIMETMAHEMLHLHQELRGTAHHNNQHNAEFHHLNKRLCAYHGWDWRYTTP